MFQISWSIRRLHNASNEFPVFIFRYRNLTLEHLIGRKYNLKDKIIVLTCVYWCAFATCSKVDIKVNLTLCSLLPSMNSAYVLRSWFDHWNVNEQCINYTNKERNYKLSLIQYKINMHIKTNYDGLHMVWKTVLFFTTQYPSPIEAMFVKS